MSTSLSATQSPDARRDRPDVLPPLFAKPTHLLGWQGLSAMLPADWNLASYGGDALKGNLRVDDEDGARLELRWEKPPGDINLAQSVAGFMQSLEKQAKKNKQAFVEAKEPRLVTRSRKRKSQLVNFGWTGERDSPAGQGWGVSWQCADCGRVVVAQIIGRGIERHEKVRALATEVLSSLECHGSGGWQTWSVFDLRVEVPEEFRLSRSRLLTGRLELEWTRETVVKSLLPAPKQLERLILMRLSLADTLLGGDSLEDWARRSGVLNDKKLNFGWWTEATIRTHDGLLGKGTLRDWRKRARAAAMSKITRRPLVFPQMRVWHCEPSNKLFALMSDLSTANDHVTDDLLESLECH